MTHLHEESDTYNLDQLCLVTFSGIFGGICLSLYFWQSAMLNLMLAKQFHGFILASGIILVGLAVTRALILWKGRAPRHQHEYCQSDHHHHHQGHSHDHDWAPWRYVFLILPIILFLLGLPNKVPTAQGATVPVDLTHESIGYATVVAGVDPLNKLVCTAVLVLDSSSQAEILDFKTLRETAGNSESRKVWDGKWITVVKGQFVPSRHSDRQFCLVRFIRFCCGADAIRVEVPMVCKEGLSGINVEDWVTVTGRIRFQKMRNSFITILQVPSRRGIMPTSPDPDFYLQ
jgi:hypothetical protein